MDIEKEIQKIEKEINWINKTCESLQKRKKHKLDKLMNLKIMEFKKLVKKTDYTKINPEEKPKCKFNLDKEEKNGNT